MSRYGNEYPLSTKEQFRNAGRNIGILVLALTLATWGVKAISDSDNPRGIESDVPALRSGNVDIEPAKTTEAVVIFQHSKAQAD